MSHSELMTSKHKHCTVYRSTERQQSSGRWLKSWLCRDVCCYRQRALHDGVNSSGLLQQRNSHRDDQVGSVAGLEQRKKGVLDFVVLACVHHDVLVFELNVFLSANRLQDLQWMAISYEVQLSAHFLAQVCRAEWIMPWSHSPSRLRQQKHLSFPAEDDMP